MANNHAEASEILEIPAEKLSQAEAIMNRLDEEYEVDDEYGYTPYCWAVHESGIWLHSDESLDLDAVEHTVKILQDELELDEPFVMEAAFTCSKPRLGEFGGAAFRAQRGQPTVWLNTGDLRDWKPDRLRTGLEELIATVKSYEEETETEDETMRLVYIVRELEALLYADAGGVF